MKSEVLISASNMPETINHIAHINPVHCHIIINAKKKSLTKLTCTANINFIEKKINLID